MGLIFLVLVGATLGWVAAIVMRSEDSRGVQLNVAAGIAGALIAGIGLHSLFGSGSIINGPYSVEGLLTALLGTVIVLVLLNVVRGRELR